MPNKETLDQVRERIRRAEEQEAQALQDHPAKQELQEWRRQRDEEARRGEEARKQEREQGRQEKRDAEMEALKNEFRNSFPGSPAEFELAWPDLKARELSRLASERVEQARQASSSYYESSF